jgi:hypothetical protein
VPHNVVHPFPSCTCCVYELSVLMSILKYFVKFVLHLLKLWCMLNIKRLKIMKSWKFQFPPHGKHCIFITKTSWLMLFREITTVYCGNHKKQLNTVCGKNWDTFNVKAGSTYDYHVLWRVNVQELLYEKNQRGWSCW